MEKESVRRHIQDLPLKTSHISDYNVGVSALADASFFFSIMESSSYDRNVMLRGIAMRRKKRLSQKFFRRKAAADAALGSIAGAGLNPAAEKRIKEKTADNKKGEDKDEKVQE